LGEKIRREDRRERWREKEREEKNGACKVEATTLLLYFFFYTVTLSPTTKIFVLENELTNKEIRV